MRIIAGNHKGKNLFCPSTLLIRPTSGLMRGAIFNMCQLTIENATFLDLFAGVGAMGLEALSRGAKQSTFVDHSKFAFDFIEKNINKLKEEASSRLLLMDAFQALEKLTNEKRSFDIIYADPPYGQKGLFLSNKVLKIVDDSSLLKAGGELLLEDDSAAQEEEIVLQKLILKSSRTKGRTLLRHYIMK